MSEFATDHEQKTRLLAEIRTLEAERADLSRRIGALESAATDLLNQLALLTRDDESYLWRIGGRPLDEAYKALKAALGGEK